MFGPLGISLAPQIRQSRGLYKLIQPIANAYARAVGHRRVGVKYDDLCKSSQVGFERTETMILCYISSN